MYEPDSRPSQHSGDLEVRDVRLGKRRGRLRTKAEFERIKQNLTIAERLLAIMCGAILMLVMLALATTAIICALRGYGWQATAGTGGCGAAVAGVLVRFLDSVGKRR